MKLGAFGMTSSVAIVRWSAPAMPDGIQSLADAARLEGYQHLARFQDEWDAGVRFDGSGECLFVALDGPALVGVGGICRDPYRPDPAVGRLRHVYVDKRRRRRGVASHLVGACLTATGTHFSLIRLRTGNPDAIRLYERIGFQPVTDTDATHILKLLGRTDRTVAAVVGHRRR